LVFADSSGFVAAFDARDAGHAVAAEAWRELARRGEKILTTALVFAETTTHLRRRAGFAVARRIGEIVLRSRGTEILPIDGSGLGAAWREFLRNGDPKLSLCDAHSFVVMRERSIERALTFDRHFEDAGFRVLPW
jgi:uncharacterized protein